MKGTMWIGGGTMIQLRLVGVKGPYSVLLGATEYKQLVESSDHG